MALTQDFETNWLLCEEKYGRSIEGSDIPVLPLQQWNAAVTLPAVKFTAAYVEGGNNQFDSFVHIPMATFQRVLNNAVTQAQTDVREAVEDAEDAAAEARQAASGVQSAISNANTAATNANTKAEQARTAAQAANDSRTAIEQNESTRQSQESVREQQEAVREQHESSRQQQESGRVSAESSRENAESGRVSAESGRVSAESGRVSAESGRVSEEKERVSAEDGRVSAEKERENKSAYDHQRAEKDHTASVKATEDAEKVNATISGMTVTITDRQGASTSVNIGFEITEDHVYPSVAAMKADAANVLPGQFCMIATTDPTSTDNAQLWARNRSGATSSNPFTFLSDLDQASSSAFSDWLNNQKPLIENATAYANAQGDYAKSEGNTAKSKGEEAERQGNKAEQQGDAAEAQGDVAEAQGNTAEQRGLTAKSQGETAAAQGNAAEAQGDEAERQGNVAESQGNTAESKGNTAAAQGNTAEAQGNTAEEQGNTAEAQGNAAETKGNFAKTQGDYAKEWNIHPPYIGNGTTGDQNYWYLYDITTSQYVRGPYAKGDNLDWDSMTQGDKDRLVQELLQTLEESGFDAVPTENSTKPVRSGGIYTAIQNETTARSQAVSGEAAARQQAVSDEAEARGQAVADEAQAREDADDALMEAITAEEARARGAEEQNADDIDAIEALIPQQATEQNQLADKAFVNSSVSTATATHRGTFNLVSDLSLTVSATQSQIATALGTAIQTADNNDYAFVQVPTADDKPTEIARVDRYKYNGTAWALEYSLNNSGFTAAQWEAINSAITGELVTKLADLPTNAELVELLAGKQDNLVFASAETCESIVAELT